MRRKVCQRESRSQELSLEELYRQKFLELKPVREKLLKKLYKQKRLGLRALKEKLIKKYLETSELTYKEAKMFASDYINIRVDGEVVEALEELEAK